MKVLGLGGGLAAVLATARRAYAMPYYVYYPLPALTLPSPDSFPSATADDVWNSVKSVFGTEWEGMVALLDPSYRLPTDDAVAAFLQVDDTDGFPYIDTWGDCDDFAQVLQGVFERGTWGYGFAFGQIGWWVPETGLGHMQNIYINDARKVKLVEPQNDRIQEWGDILSLYPSARPFLIVI
ncbi:MAG: hypothetical protein QXR87_03320 [Candidatus Hadarchaeales archaeon]